MDAFRNSILIGDALTTLKTLPDTYVQTCITSPPYYALRNYNTPGQIGLESDPEEYISKLFTSSVRFRRFYRGAGIGGGNLGKPLPKERRGCGNESGNHEKPRTGRE